MSKLNKEEVLEHFTAAYQAAHGSQPAIEQKSGWYKVNDGKSVRLAELVEMTNALTAGEQAEAAKPSKPSKPAKPSAKKESAAKPQSTGGLTPKALWAQKNSTGCRLPRGF